MAAMILGMLASAVALSVHSSVPPTLPMVDVWGRRRLAFRLYESLV